MATTSQTDRYIKIKRNFQTFERFVTVLYTFLCNYNSNIFCFIDHNIIRDNWNRAGAHEFELGIHFILQHGSKVGHRLWKFGHSGGCEPLHTLQDNHVKITGTWQDYIALQACGHWHFQCCCYSFRWNNERKKKKMAVQMILSYSIQWC